MYQSNEKEFLSIIFCTKNRELLLKSKHLENFEIHLTQSYKNGQLENFEKENKIIHY